VVWKKPAPTGIQNAELNEEKESALELLKKRLVKGEIGPEQYRQLRDILLER
jgi:uncharacterized membrane protein